MMKTFVVSFCINFLITIVLFAQGQTLVIHKATITGAERWSGHIIIKGDVTVARSGRLQIDPGTRITFAPNSDENHSGMDKTRAELIVKGSIFAKGTINHKIVFTSAAPNPRMQDWRGIVIMNLNNPAVFEFAIVEYAFNGFDIKKSNPIIKNCQIQFNYNAGVKVAVRSRAKLIGNIISDNGYAGVICETGAQPYLADNLITKNQIGLIVFGTAQPNLGNLNKGNEYNPGRNALFDNYDYDVYNHGVKEIKAEGNSWGSNKLADILAHIYDKKDAQRFGAVDFNPIIGNVDLLRKMLLTQQPPVAVKQDTVQNASKTTKEGSTLAARNAPANSGEKQPPVSNVQETTSIIPKKKVTNLTAADTSRISPTKNKNLMPDTASRIASSQPKKEEQVQATKVEKPRKKETIKIDYSQVFLDVFLDKKVEVVKAVKPVIDDPAKGMYEHGKVVVRVIVGRDGKVEEAKVLRGLNYYYDGLALEAAKNFVFKPGAVKGHPVRFSTSILFRF